MGELTRQTWAHCLCPTPHGQRAGRRNACALIGSIVNISMLGAPCDVAFHCTDLILDFTFRMHHFLCLLLLSLKVAKPTLGHQSGATLSHRQRYNICGEAAGTYLNSKHETSQYAYQSDGIFKDTITIATEHVARLAPGIDYRLVSDNYTDEDTGVTHAYFFQTFQGIDIENTQINVNVKRDGSILSAGTNFLSRRELKSPCDTKLLTKLDPAEALRGVFETLKLPGNADHAVAVPSKLGDCYTIHGVHKALSVRFVVRRLSSHCTYLQLNIVEAYCSFEILSHHRRA